MLDDQNATRKGNFILKKPVLTHLQESFSYTKSQPQRTSSAIRNHISNNETMKKR